MLKFSLLEDCLIDLQCAVREKDWKVFNSEKERYLSLVAELSDKKYKVCLTNEGVKKMQKYYMNKLECLREVMLHSENPKSKYPMSWMRAD